MIKGKCECAIEGVCECVIEGVCECVREGVCESVISRYLQPLPTSVETTQCITSVSIPAYTLQCSRTSVV